MGNSTSAAFADDETNTLGLGSGAFTMKMPAGSQPANISANREEVERLKSELEERDRQLREQAATLADMEVSLTELQGLIENGDGPPGQLMRRGSVDDKDAAQLRLILKEKNDKIALLTGEFDAHRADFRSTIDTLEMASSETERVYEKRIEELMQEIHDLQDRHTDVDAVASQLKQMEELVQELEEGLEDARRGEAEARGEVEFLRGEVERTKSELRREREKAGPNGYSGTNGTKEPGSKELEQKEDEIRGLKAIIHSLSRDGVDGAERTPTARSGPRPLESMDDRRSREQLEREMAELRALLNNKTSQAEDLEREVQMLRRASGNNGVNNRSSSMTVTGANERSSLRDSRGTVIMAPRSPDGHHKTGGVTSRHSRGATLDTMPESDTYSTATEQSTLWCEICETAGHDILSCTNMFGPQADQKTKQAVAEADASSKTGKDVVREGLRTLAQPTAEDDPYTPAPLSPVKTKATLAPPVRIMPNPMDSGLVAGKESGTVDETKWCALCERDGHDSVDCPFEDAF
jgi:hypothetical protein